MPFLPIPWHGHNKLTRGCPLRGSRTPQAHQGASRQEDKDDQSHPQRVPRVQCPPRTRSRLAGPARFAFGCRRDGNRAHRSCPQATRASCVMPPLMPPCWTCCHGRDMQPLTYIAASATCQARTALHDRRCARGGWHRMDDGAAASRNRSHHKGDVISRWCPVFHLQLY